MMIFFLFPGQKMLLPNNMKQWVYNENMMGDYIWGLMREHNLRYNCKFQKTIHL